MNAGDIAVTIVLVLTLGAVLWYACEARKQAKASTEMAREMRLSRQDESRPVLDLHGTPQEAFGTGPDAMTEAVAQKFSEDSVWCRLKNVGRGPALNIKALIRQGIGPKETNLGTLGVGEEGERKAFTISKAVDEYFLDVQYEDVYGRRFFSRRPVMFDQGDPRLCALETGEVPSS